MTTTPAIAPVSLSLRFDSTPCVRCGGEGIVRPWGTCFRCGGAKTFHTAAGKRARAAWEAFKREVGIIVDPAAVKVGDRLFIPTQFAGPNNGGQFIKYRGAAEVTRVERGVQTDMVGVGDGPIGPRHTEYVDIDFRVARRPGTPWITYVEETSSIRTRVFLIGAEHTEKLERRPTADELRAFAERMKGRKGWTLIETPAAPASTTEAK